MEYLFREKLIRPGLKIQDVFPRMVLIAEPSKPLCEIYARLFNPDDFMVHSCTEYAVLNMLLRELDPALLLLTITPFKHDSFSHVKKITKNHPELKIITMSHDSEQQGLGKLMSLGVSGHINKKLTRPKDVVELALHVLQY